MRRRGLEPPPGYPGPGPQPGASTNSAIGARDGASIDPAARSARVAHPGGDAVDGEEARARERLLVALGPRARPAQKLDLDERHRVDVGVAAVDRGAQLRAGGHQPAPGRAPQKAA